jgi:hypothetical protein
MPEALTESFCERCGTRYEFKAPTRLNPLRKTRGLMSGLRHYIMSQDALSDAVGDAMRSEEELLAARQLESFHESFNFCIDCRQYTCNACWNQEAGRCRTCVPVAGTDDLIEGFEASFAGEPVVAEAPAVSAEAWPSADLADGAGVLDWPAAELREEGEAFPSPEPVVAEVEPEPEPEPVVAEVEPEPEPEPVVLAWDSDAPFDLAPEPMVQPAEIEGGPPIVFAEAPKFGAEEAPPPLEPSRSEPPPDLVVEAEMIELTAEAPSLPHEEFVPAPVEHIVEAEPEPAVAETVEAEPERAVAEIAKQHSDVEPTPLEAPWADSQPEAITPQQPARVEEQPPVVVPLPTAVPAPAAEEDAGIAAAAAADDPALAARRAQLDSLGLGNTARGTVESVQRPARPYRSSGAGVHPTEAAEIDRARLASPAQAIRASMWDASAREVAGGTGSIGVQNCGGCGLSLSASARFCRRCGAPQARSA